MNIHESFFQFFQKLHPILLAIKNADGTSYLVGGCVRDLVLDRPLKDFDIEVHNLSLEQLEAILSRYNHVHLVGKKFGVLRIVGLDVDWSLPRKDSKGRKPEVAIDPFMSIQDACRRRDLTMNAMAIDLNLLLNDPTKIKTCQIIDPYGGLEDIKHKQLRVIDQTLFLEDPLRFFRVMQFIGRFEMMPDEQLNQLCKTMSLWDSQTGTALARERIYEEIKKLFLKSQRPSEGFRWLRSIDRLRDTFPQLDNLVAVKQSPIHHPEGDVFEHTMQTLDAAAHLPYYQDQSYDERFLIMLGALCHDLGKAVTTDADCHAYGHEIQGVALGVAMLKQITDDQFIIKSVSKLVRYHLAPFSLLQDAAGDKAYKKLASKLAPEMTLRQLALVALADRQGRNGSGQEPLTDSYHNLYQEFLQAAQHADVAHGPEAPALLGRHLLDVIQPGTELGALLQLAYHIQVEEGIKDPDVLRQRVLAQRSKPLG